MLFLANIAGVLYAYRRAIAVAVAGLVLFSLLFLGYKACNRPPKLDEQQIQKGEKAVKEQNDAELANVLVESDVAEAEALNPSIEGKAHVQNVQTQSREKWNNANRDELQAEFDRRKNQ